MGAMRLGHLDVKEVDGLAGIELCFEYSVLKIHSLYGWTMTKTGYKNILIALLLLAFTSQSFAALTMPCQFVSQTSMSMDMSNMAGMDHANMAGMDHSGMHSSDKTTSKPISDCCKTVGHCSSGSCSLAFFGHSFDVSLLSLHTDVNVSYTNVIPERLASSLFRPPIFC